MTTQGLLLLILLGIFVQVLVYAGVAFFRYWLSYQALKEQGTAGAEAALATLLPVAGNPMPAWTGTRDFRVIRRQYEDAGRNVCSFFLAPLDAKPLPDFLPGQFLTFQLDVADPAGAGRKSIVRCYSLSDRASPEYYRVSIKRVPAASPGATPGLSSNHFHDHVQAGDVLAVKAPSGHFHLDVASDAAVVLIAGGIGITPIYCMLASALAVQPAREVWLFYGVRDGSEMIMDAQLAELADAHPNFHLHISFSRPDAEDLGGRDHRHAGRVDIERLRLELSLKPYHFYICGPGPMMETLVPALQAWGVPDARIHYEAFGPATVSRHAEAAAGPAFSVMFSGSGRRVDWNGGVASLLELAEANGIRIDSGCRAGCCGACQTVIESGEILYEQRPEFNVDPGKCLLCLAKPRTDLVLSA